VSGRLGDDLGVTIRQATALDAPALTAFGRRTFHDTFASQNMPEDMEAYLNEAFNQSRQDIELHDPHTTTLLAEADGVLVGYAQLRRGEAPACVAERDSVELVRFYVDVPWQGRGVAPRLMQATREAAAAYARGIWLGVWEKNLRAIAFYTKAGFAHVGSHEFRLGSDVQTDHIMARRLAMM